jgi:hypothetical protein
MVDYLGNLNLQQGSAQEQQCGQEFRFGMNKYLRSLFFLISFFISGIAKVISNFFFQKKVNALHFEIRKLRILLHSTVIPRQYILALVAGEDHRFFFHQGIDPIGVVRATMRTCLGRVQGGSTIEQQLVRTLTGDYRRCIGRKASEMLLAATIYQVLTKEEIARTYLAIAYFGTGMNGFSAALKKLDLGSPFVASALIAQLKYPMPRASSDKFLLLRQARINYISIRKNSLINWVPDKYTSLDEST